MLKGKRISNNNCFGHLLADFIHHLLDHFGRVLPFDDSVSRLLQASMQDDIAQWQNSTDGRTYGRTHYWYIIKKCVSNRLQQSTAQLSWKRLLWSSDRYKKGSSWKSAKLTFCDFVQIRYFTLPPAHSGADLKFVATGGRVNFFPAVYILPENRAVPCKICIEIWNSLIYLEIFFQN